MAATLLLDTATWDLVLDANNNIAVATEPYSLAQDAAAAIQTYSDGGPNRVGECYWDTTVGVPYLTQILGKNPSVSLLKELLVAAALTVQDVASAQVFLSSVTDRAVSGQVQVVSAATGVTSAAAFATSV